MPAAEHDEADFVLCRLCKRTFHRVTGSHLYWKHHLETGEYRERFPNAPFFSEENKRKLSRSIIRAWERVGRHWTKERVRTTIQSMHRRRQPLHAREIKERHADLYTAAMRLYYSWDQALIDAGQSPESIRHRRVWTGNHVIRAMKEAAVSGEFRAGARFRRHHSGLVQAAVLRWGSWSAALAAAGLRPLRPAPVRWTRKEVVRRIHIRATRGDSLLATEVHGHALRKAAERFFKKTWPEVVRELGYDYEGRERWSKARIVKDLRRLRRGGLKLNFESVRHRSSALVQAAVRHFKTWPVALQAAGVDPLTLKPRHWTRDELRRLFGRLRQAGRLSLHSLRKIRRRGYVQPATSVRRHWRTLEAAFRVSP